MLTRASKATATATANSKIDQINQRIANLARLAGGPHQTDRGETLMDRRQRDVTTDRANLTQAQDGLRNRALITVKPVLEGFNRLLEIKPEYGVVSSQ